MHTDRAKAALAIIDQAVEQFNPSHIFGMFSGGHDSMCSTHIASLHPRFSGAFAIDTTIGIEETREYRREVVKLMGWKYLEWQPPTSYRDIILKEGFPGPGAHRYMYIRLKERVIDRLIREHKTKRQDRILLITGVRLSESKRRMGHVEAIKREKCKVWVAPILNWSAADKIEHMEQYQLPENPVVKNMCMSGECLCGAFAEKAEMEQLRFFYPKAAAYIEGLQREAQIAGVHHKWGTRPPPKPGPMEMCWSCDAKKEVA